MLKVQPFPKNVVMANLSEQKKGRKSSSVFAGVAINRSRSRRRPSISNAEHNLGIKMRGGREKCNVRNYFTCIHPIDKIVENPSIIFYATRIILAGYRDGVESTVSVVVPQQTDSGGGGGSGSGGGGGGGWGLRNWWFHRQINTRYFTRWEMRVCYGLLTTSRLYETKF
ncbi:hypothetical protein HZH66_014869 [Vespula vulgaris]|uniref:Uncharacterized protein n=1 Tax=Vespula vulgaris TaxID=7454 RepID=A0A834IZ50_VESVU|nr:hypothetical protein HZH66_014869 [Vespula vulgaris]